MQRSRRRDPYPFAWEIPLAAAAAVGLLLVLGVHAGRAAANALAGAGWAWPARADLYTSLTGVLAGDPAAGLDALRGPGAGPGLLYGCIAATELLLLLLTGAAVTAGLDRWGPGRLRGAASRAQAQRLLGEARLRQAAPIVRPDRYGRQRRRT